MNTAARLEDANKMFGGTVCVSGDTAGRAIDHRFRPIGRLYLAGKEKPVEAWEPILCKDTTEDALDSYMIAYEYLDEDPDKAMKLLKKMAKAKLEDTLVQYQLSRLKAGLHGTTLVHSKKL